MKGSIRNKALKEAAIIAATTLIITRLAISFDLLNMVVDLTQIYDDLNLYERIIIPVFLISSLGLLSFYKSKELQNDLKEHEKLEKIIKESEKKYRMIFENSPIGICYIDKNGKITHCNEEFTRIFGAKGNTSGLNLQEYLTNENLRTAIELALSGKIGNYEGEYVTVESGKRIAIKVNCNPIISEDGSTTGCIGLFEEITQHKKLENALRSSEEKYYTIVEKGKDGIVIVQDEMVKFANSRMSDMAGYSIEELIDTPILKYISEDHQEIVIERYRRRIKKDQTLPSSYEIDFLSKKGDRIPVEINVSYMDYEGRPATMAIVRDITERRQAEEKIQENELKFHSLVHSAQDAIVLIDHTGKIIFWNKSAESIFLYKQEEMVGQPLTTIMPERYKDAHKKVLGRSVSVGKTVELQGLRKDGKEIPIEISLASWESSGKVYYSGIIRNITKRKEAEKELLIKDIAMESSISAIAFADLDANLTYVNSAFLELWGYEDKEEVLGKPTTVFWDQESKASQIVKALFDSGSWKGDMVAIRKNNMTFDVHLSANMIMDEENKPIGMMGSFLDITQSKKAEEALVDARIKAEDANRSKSEFLANMSHELRTPLNSVIGFSEILITQKFGPLNKRQMKYAGNISNSGKHLLELINDILDLSKIEAGKMELNIEEFCIGETIDEVRTMLMPLASKKKINVTYNLSTDLIRLKADRIKFKQILYNLVNNAIKFTPPGGSVTVSSRIVEDKVKISVEDTGIGISKQDQRRLFQHFTQLHRFGSREQEGTGLGLALVKKFTEMHEGHVKVSSEVNKGSIFTVKIPLDGPEKVPGHTIKKIKEETIQG